MGNVLDIKDLQYINLFEKITRVSTRFCFKYNDAIVFAVPKHLVSKAVGRNGENVKELNRVTRRKIKVIPIPQGEGHAREFIQAIVKPVTFKDLEVADDKIIITAGSQNKAALLGRNKRRLIELQGIVKDFFSRELRIV